jgi:hypothetical protein
MAKKKKEKQAKRMPKRAVPPPDNPLLRDRVHEPAPAGGIDEKQMAQARAKALQKAKQMPDADQTDTKPDGEAS